MATAKVSIIGAGFVGSTTACYLAEKNLCSEIVLVDINEGPVRGKALDLSQAGAILNYDSTIIGTSDYSLIRGSHVVVITAGLPRKPGMDRMDLIRANSEIVGQCASQIRAYAPESIIIVVTNPLDVMCHVALEKSGFPRERVIGMAGILDTARFQTFVAWEIGCKKSDVQTWVLGGHGNQMVPVIEHTTVKSKPITEFVNEDKLSALIKRTRDGGAEIVQLFGQGSAYFAPAASINQMIEAILKNTGEVRPVSVYLQGEYGYGDIYLGVPAKLGRQGLIQVIELELNDRTKELLKNSVAEVKKGVELWRNL